MTPALFRTATAVTVRRRWRTALPQLWRRAIAFIILIVTSATFGALSRLRPCTIPTVAMSRVGRGRPLPRSLKVLVAGIAVRRGAAVPWGATATRIALVRRASTAHIVSLARSWWWAGSWPTAPVTISWGFVILVVTTVVVSRWWTMLFWRWPTTIQPQHLHRLIRVITRTHRTFAGLMPQAREWLAMLLV